jgi:hypothetical protein
MDGHNDLEKKLNAYLCYSLIGTDQIPTDECSTYAVQITNLAEPDDVEKIYRLIKRAFGGSKISEIEQKKFEQIAAGAAAINMVERRGR